jgi:hypothetical protein
MFSTFEALVRKQNTTQCDMSPYTLAFLAYHGRVVADQDRDTDTRLLGAHLCGGGLT